MKSLQVWSALFVCFLLSACSVVEGPPAPDSGFLKDAEQMKHDDTLPIDAVWISDTFRKNYDNYKKVIVKPVNTDYLFRTGDWSHVQIKSKEEIKKDAKEIAEYIEKNLKKTFSSGRVPRLSLTEESGTDTLVFEVAITELIPTDVVRNAAGDVAGFFVPGGGLVSAGSGGRISVETRVTDGKTKEILFMSKNHKVDQIAPVDLAGLTPYRHIENNIDNMVDKAVEILNAPLGTKIRPSSPVTLSPW